MLSGNSIDMLVSMSDELGNECCSGGSVVQLSLSDYRYRRGSTLVW